MRGSSAFEGACDTIISATKAEKTITIECTKQKDAEPFELAAFDLRIIEEWNSCVVCSPEFRINQETDKVRAFMLDDPSLTVRDIAELTGISKSTVGRKMMEIRKSLKEGVGQDLTSLESMG